MLRPRGWEEATVKAYGYGMVYGYVLGHTQAHISVRTATASQCTRVHLYVFLLRLLLRHRRLAWGSHRLTCLTTHSTPW